MAQGHQGHEAQGVEPPLVFAVLREAALDGLEIGQEISVRQHHPARLSRGAAGEEDLRHVPAGQGLVRQGQRPGRFAGGFQSGHILQDKQRHGGRERGLFARGHDQADRGIPDHPRGELRRGRVVQGNGHGAAQQAAPEGHHPVRAVRPPQQDSLAGANAALAQLQSKLCSQPRQFAVASHLAAVAVARDDGGVPAKPGEFVHEFAERVARHARWTGRHTAFQPGRL